MEFLDAYRENLKNQSRDAVNFNALADIIRTICDEELASSHEVEYTLPESIGESTSEQDMKWELRLTGISTKFAWAKTPQSLSEELMHLTGLVEDSYGYKIERYLDTVGRKGRKKNNSVIRITNLNIEPEQENNTTEESFINETCHDVQKVYITPSLPSLPSLPYTTNENAVEFF